MGAILALHIEISLHIRLDGLTTKFTWLFAWSRRKGVALIVAQIISYSVFDICRLYYTTSCTHCLILPVVFDLRLLQVMRSTLCTQGVRCPSSFHI